MVPPKAPHADKEQASQTRDRIWALLQEQPFGVLCTQGDGQPYGSVVAYAIDQDMRCLAFATPKASRKYELLCGCDAVAIVIDSRPTFPDDLASVEALTAVGRAAPLGEGTEFNRWAAALAGRHPQIESFIYDPSSALFRVDISRYRYVYQFQKVRQWQPEPSVG